MGKAKINWFKVAMALLPAIRKGLAELESAVAEDSDGGSKITPDEAANITTVILSSAYDPLLAVILDAAKS